MSEDTEGVMVEEGKFNGVATLKVDAPDKEHARAGAKQFWRETYGSNPSKIVVEDEDRTLHSYTVMVADHSSGSLKDTMTFDL